MKGLSQSNLKMPGKQHSSQSKEKYFEKIREVIFEHLNGYQYELYLFGSQSRGKAGRTSDIDIAILPKTPLPAGLLSKIREELDESRIPYPVDLVDLSKSTPAFLEQVKAEGRLWSG
ncbi:toxin-antitoxin system, toxin component family protein [delta proteobacterium NaphS2]|nr:toxin-antitoxin system, toxin component family protein [delta proteobacterium NaphS2]